MWGLFVVRSVLVSMASIQQTCFAVLAVYLALKLHADTEIA